MPDERDTISVADAYKKRLWQRRGVVLSIDHYSRLITFGNNDTTRPIVEVPETILWILPAADGGYTIGLIKSSGEVSRRSRYSGKFILHYSETEQPLREALADWREWHKREFKRGGNAAEAF